MTSQASKVMLIVAGCLILPGGVLLGLAFSQQAEDYAQLGAAVDHHALWLWYLMGALVGILLFFIGTLLYSHRDKRGMWMSQTIDIIVSLALGILIVQSKNVRWLMIWLGFAAVAYVDYVMRFWVQVEKPQNGHSN